MVEQIEGCTDLSVKVHQHLKSQVRPRCRYLRHYIWVPHSTAKTTNFEGIRVPLISTLR
jgi:hypothetical protein